MINIDHRKLLRTAQTHFPYLAEVKPWIQHGLGTFFNQPFEADFNAFRSFAPSRLYVDVGANRGQSINAIRMTARAPKIISFEANPVLAGRLVKRYRRSEDVSVHAYGLGAAPSLMTLYIPKYRDYVFDGLASIYREEAVSWLSERTLYNFDKDKLSCLSVECEIRTLDSLDIAPFLIKLDIQGGELNALIGARKTLVNYTPALLIETPGTGIVAYLRELGYETYYFSRGMFNKGNNYALNLFFFTPEKARQIPPHVRAF